MRLFKELNSYKVLVIISIILAVASTILTIFCPNKMADLTDEIRYGLTINTSALNEVVTKTREKLQEKRLENIEVNGVSISPQDQIVFMSIMQKVDGEEKASLYKAYEDYVNEENKRQQEQQEEYESTYDPNQIRDDAMSKYKMPDINSITIIKSLN